MIPFFMSEAFGEKRSFENNAESTLSPAEQAQSWLNWEEGWLQKELQKTKIEIEHGFTDIPPSTTEEEALKEWGDPSQLKADDREDFDDSIRTITADEQLKRRQYTLTKLQKRLAELPHEREQVQSGDALVIEKLAQEEASRQDYMKEYDTTDYGMYGRQYKLGYRYSWDENDPDLPKGI
jgi:predicted metal-dependent hydrolase